MTFNGIIKLSHGSALYARVDPVCEDSRAYARLVLKSKIECRENVARIRVARLSSHVMQMHSIRDADAGRGRKRVRPLERSLRNEFT
jgi:hypothetical protein